MRSAFASLSALLWLAPAAAWAAVPVAVGGDSVCPSPAEVASRVNALLPEARSNTPLPAARVDRRGGELRVRLGDDGAVAIAERTLPTGGTCAEMAEVVAVTITSWLSQLRPESVPAPQFPVQAQVAPPTRSPLAFDVGAGVGAELAEGGLAGAATALLFVHLGARGPGLHVRASGTTGHEVALGARKAAWQRWAIDVGPSYQAPIGEWRLAIGVGFSAGLLSAEGRDFPRNHSASRFSPGVGGVIRLARPLSWWAPWIAAGASAAFGTEPLTVIGSSERRDLHPFGAYACAGISLGKFPALTAR